MISTRRITLPNTMPLLAGSILGSPSGKEASHFGLVRSEPIFLSKYFQPETDVSRIKDPPCESERRLLDPVTVWDRLKGKS